MSVAIMRHVEVHKQCSCLPVRIDPSGGIEGFEGAERSRAMRGTPFACVFAAGSVGAGAEFLFGLAAACLSGTSAVIVTLCGRVTSSQNEETPNDDFEEEMSSV